MGNQTSGYFITYKSAVEGPEYDYNPDYNQSHIHADYTGFYVGIFLCSLFAVLLLLINVFFCCSPWKKYWTNWNNSGNRMFMAYWPVLALVVSFILLGVFLTLMFGGNLCGGRHTAKPERSLESYLPQDDNPFGNQDLNLAAADLPPGEPNFEVIGETQGYDSYNSENPMGLERRPRELGV